MADQPHLDACPFCAGKAKAHTGLHMFVDVIVRCEGCMTEGPLFDYEADGDDDEALERNMAAAAKHWNTRAPAAAPDREEKHA